MRPGPARSSVVRTVRPFNSGRRRRRWTATRCTREAVLGCPSAARGTLRRVAEPSLHHVDVNGVDFAYLALGAGPLALCLHGFPDSAHTWRHLLPRLADAGYRAVAPFQRGYAPTAVPADGRYQTGVLALDAIGFHEALGGDDQAVIIGHDWGAPATWGAAVHAPDRWRRVVGLAVPPGSAMGAAFVTNRTQLKRSWYMFFFQHPLADLVVAADDLALRRHAVAGLVAGLRRRR